MRNTNNLVSSCEVADSAQYRYQPWFLNLLLLGTQSVTDASINSTGKDMVPHFFDFVKTRFLITKCTSDSLTALLICAFLLGIWELFIYIETVRIYWPLDVEVKRRR